MAAGIKVRRLGTRDRAAALAHLERTPRLNLVLIDLVLRLEAAAPTGEPAPKLIGAFRDARLVGLLAVRPSVLLDASSEPEAREALLPHLARGGTGLVKNRAEIVAPIARWLRQRGWRLALDRIEIGYALERGEARLVAPGEGALVRAASPRDLDALVEAARASLREEGRPDAFEGDPKGFRRWVQGRIPQAVIVETGGRVVFVGYADVRCARGWLLQGVYTWPPWRRRGLAKVGVSELCRQAFASGADHVQLAVVEGNQAGQLLYERLGFRPFARLRTLLFA